MKEGALFANRRDAGKQLAVKLTDFKQDPNALVLGLPRGGVVVAYEIAKALELTLDIWLVRKLGVPGQEEFAMGAISNGEVLVLNQEIVSQLRLSQEAIYQVKAKEKAELARRAQRYRGNRPALELTGKKVILVDDGIATGATMEAAILAIKKQNPAKLIIAVPVSSTSALKELRRLVDQFTCLYSTEPFYSVGLYYQDFDQTSDEEVCALLEADK